MAAFRYWKFEVTEADDYDSGWAAYIIQYSEFQLLISGVRQAASSVQGFHSDGFFGGAGEVPANINDNSTGSKWVTPLSGCVAILDYGSAITPDAYRWYTANDNADLWDPISWTLSASNDRLWWTHVETQTNYATTSSRNTLVGPFSFTSPADGGTPTRSGGVDYRYFRFTPVTNVAGGSSTTAYAEVTLYSEGNRVQATTVTGPAGTGANGTDKVDDFDLYTYLSATLANSYVVYDFGSSQNFDQWAWYSAAATDGTRPADVTLEGSLDNTNWTLLDSRTATHTAKWQKFGPYPLVPAAAPYVRPRIQAPTQAVHRASRW